MQRHTSMFRRGLLIWWLTLVAAPVSAALAQGEPPSPWTAERANALVRIEAPGKHPAPEVATGFIVNGHGGKQYVATVTHGLLPTATDTQKDAFKPDKCEPLPDGTKLFQGNRGGPELRPKCAYHIGNDPQEVSLVELYPGTSPLPALLFLACDLVADDDVYLGGFALGYDRILMAGAVRGNGSQGMIIAEALTAAGLSGGPYLTADGDVVAIHRGLAYNTPGYAEVVPVSAVRTKLEALLPEVKTENACPKPVAHPVAENQMAALSEKLAALLGVNIEDSPQTTFDQRIQQVEEVINELRQEVQWDMNVDKRMGVGNVVSIEYHRLLPGEPPASDMALKVTPLTDSPANSALIYSGNHIQIEPGKSGKYEVSIDSSLKSLAVRNDIPIDAVRIELRYKTGADVLATTQLTLSPPFIP